MRHLILAFLWVGCASSGKTLDVGDAPQPSVTHGAEDAEWTNLPAVSADGRWIVHAAHEGDTRDGEAWTNIVVVGVEGGADETFKVSVSQPMDAEWDDATRAAKGEETRAAVAAANRRLARVKWLPMTPVDGAEGVALAFEGSTLTFSVDDAVVLTEVHDDWPAPPSPACPDTDEYVPGCGCSHPVVIYDAFYEPRTKTLMFTQDWEGMHACEDGKPGGPSRLVRRY